VLVQRVRQPTLYIVPPRARGSGVNVRMDKMVSSSAKRQASGATTALAPILSERVEQADPPGRAEAQAPAGQQAPVEPQEWAVRPEPVEPPGRLVLAARAEAQAPAQPMSTVQQIAVPVSPGQSPASMDSSVAARAILSSFVKTANHAPAIVLLDMRGANNAQTVLGLGCATAHLKERAVRPEPAEPLERAEARAQVVLLAPAEAQEPAEHRVQAEHLERVDLLVPAEPLERAVRPEPAEPLERAVRPEPAERQVVVEPLAQQDLVERESSTKTMMAMQPMLTVTITTPTSILLQPKFATLSTITVMVKLTKVVTSTVMAAALLVQRLSQGRALAPMATTTATIKTLRLTPVPPKSAMATMTTVMALSTKV